MERDASTPTMSVDTPSSRKDWCRMLFDSFTGSRLAYLETPEGGTRSSSHRAAELPTRGHTVAAERRANPSTGGDPHPEPRRFSEHPRSIHAAKGSSGSSVVAAHGAGGRRPCGTTTTVFDLRRARAPELARDVRDREPDPARDAGIRAVLFSRGPNPFPCA